MFINAFHCNTIFCLQNGMAIWARFLTFLPFLDSKYLEQAPNMLGSNPSVSFHLACNPRFGSYYSAGSVQGLGRDTLFILSHLHEKLPVNFTAQGLWCPGQKYFCYFDYIVYYNCSDTFIFLMTLNIPLLYKSQITKNNICLQFNLYVVTGQTVFSHKKDLSLLHYIFDREAIAL